MSEFEPFEFQPWMGYVAGAITFAAGWAIHSELAVSARAPGSHARLRHGRTIASPIPHANGRWRVGGRAALRVVRGLRRADRARRADRVPPRSPRASSWLTALPAKFGRCSRQIVRSPESRRANRRGACRRRARLQARLGIPL